MLESVHAVASENSQSFSEIILVSLSGTPSDNGDALIYELTFIFSVSDVSFCRWHDAEHKFEDIFQNPPPVQRVGLTKGAVREKRASWGYFGSMGDELRAHNYTPGDSRVL